MKAIQFVSNQQLLAWSGHVECDTFCFPTSVVLVTWKAVHFAFQSTSVDRGPGDVESDTIRFPTNERGPGHAESDTFRFATNERGPGDVESGTPSTMSYLEGRTPGSTPPPGRRRAC